MVAAPPPLTGTPPLLKKSSGNKGWLAAGLLLLFLIVIAAMFAPFMLSSSSRDLPEPPDDSDLKSRAVEIPSEENAWAYYVLAVNAVNLSEDDYDRLFANEETYSALIEILIEKNATAFKYYHQAVATTQSQAPILESYEEDSGIEEVDTSDLLFLVYRDFRLRFFQGDEFRALEEALEMAELGSKLMHSHGIGFFYSEGAYVLYYSLDEFIKLVGLSKLSAEQLRTFSGALDALYDDGTGLAGALIEEYPLLANELLDVGKVEMPDDEEFPELLRKFGEIVERSAASAYHMNRMRTDLVESLRPLIANADKPLSEMHLDILNEAEAVSLTDTFSAIRPKGLSRLMVLQMLPFLRDPIEEKCATNSLVAIAQTTLALKLYSLDHAALPASLDELVPDYLDNVPLDDMDGRPIRYDRDRKILYSVGTDLVDSSGSDPDLGYDGDDPSWSVDFEASAETSDGGNAN